MKTKCKIVIGLIALVVVAAIFGPRWYTTLKIRSQVAAQLSQRLPHTMFVLGRDRQLQRVDILRCRRSEDGRSYDVQFALLHDADVHTESGCIMTRDEWGTYRGEWSYGSNHVKFAVE